MLNITQTEINNASTEDLKAWTIHPSFLDLAE
jgi:hypothetical protein